MYAVLVGKGAGVFDLAKTPSGHLAIKVDEYGAAAEDNGSMAFTITANPHCEEPTAWQLASRSAGAPATNDARAYMMSLDTKGIRFSINEETFAYAIQSLVSSAPQTWHRRNTTDRNVPAPADQDFALRALQSK
eukprot:9345132-Pyramimonas_sp.AAC.1